MKSLDFWTDSVAMWAVVLIGICTTSYLSASITPDLWSQVVMGIFGGGLPLISVRFLIKKKFRFFWMTVGLIVFSDVSMVLSLTEGQSRAYVAESSTETPKELTRLQDATNAAQTTLDGLTTQYGQAQKRDTLAELDKQIGSARDDLRTAQNAERSWKPVATGLKINSHSVFMAIPTAITSNDLSRWMTLVFALFIAVVYQGTVISTTQATIKNVKRSEGKIVRHRRKRGPNKPKTAEPIPATEEDFRQEPTGLDA